MTLDIGSRTEHRSGFGTERARSTATGRTVGRRLTRDGRQLGEGWGEEFGQEVDGPPAERR